MKTRKPTIKVRVTTYKKQAVARSMRSGGACSGGGSCGQG